MPINKPSGLFSLLGKNPWNLDSIHHRLVQIYSDYMLIYRLDFGTSGLMVVARDKTTSTMLCQQLSQRAVTKVYSALLCRHLESGEGIIGAVVAKDPALFPLTSICTLNGKPARSYYQVVERFYHRQGEGMLLPLARIQLTLETGRTHQLRTRYQQLGHLILGCDLYGGRLLPEIEQTSRLMLYASELHLRHPISEAWMNAKNASPF